MAYYLAKDTSAVTPLPYLPKQFQLPGETAIVLDRAQTSDELEIYNIYRYVVEEEGNSYPYYEVEGLDAFRMCFMSRDTFVVRKSESGSESKVVGAFYIKPNYPARSGHICNGGFLVHKDHRRQGIGTVMAKAMLPIARDIGYKAVMYNLVYVNNAASLRLWRKVGFREIGRIPNAGDLKNVEGFTDAIQFYYDLSEVSPEFEL